jgi:hypothetical protein
MSDGNSNTYPDREWSIAEVAFGEVPPIPAAKVEVTPEPVAPKSARRALVDTITAWSVQYDLRLPEGVDIDNDDDGDLRVTLQGLALDVAHGIVPREREYLWTGSISITVQVSGTVKASTEDEANDLADEALRNTSVEVEADGYDTDVCYEGHEYEDHNLHDVDEQ